MLVRVLKPFKAPHKMVQPGEVFDADTFIAKDYIAAGIAVAFQTPNRIVKMRPAPMNKMQPAPLNKASEAGKALAAGADQPSSVSQAAQALPSETLKPSVSRATLKLKKVRRSKRSA